MTDFTKYMSEYRTSYAKAHEEAAALSGSHEPFQPPPQRTELIWAAIDYDGTLTKSEWPDFTPSEPIWRNVIKLAALRQRGYKIAIHTARSWESYELIESWLNHYEIPFDRIVCGKLLAAVYVDDRARWADESSWLPRELETSE